MNTHQGARSRCEETGWRSGALASALATGLLAAGSVFAQPTIQVPQDASLISALQQVATGGVIEIAAGTYPAPSRGFRARINSKSFTMRAAPGATVTLDGETASTILRVDGTSGSGHTLTVVGLTFRNGLSADPVRGGALSIDEAQVFFVDCELEGNVNTAGAGGGGAAQIRGGSVASFSGCTWTGNTALSAGGAIWTSQSTVLVDRNVFDRNRVNVSGHAANAAGGAIYAFDSRVRVTASRFEDNEAAWVGGAIYGFGTWQEPLAVPATEITVDNSTFVSNRASPDACCSVPGPTAGGAIHVEDHTTLVASASRWRQNRANWGGALSSYRAVIELADSELRGNEAELSGPFVGAGGAVNITSSDFADASTEFGAINRRPAELHATNTLFRGRSESATATAEQGGCLFAAGDGNRLGGGAVPAQGSVADNRAVVDLDEVVFEDCDARSAESTAHGGAIHLNLAALTMTDSLVAGSEAIGAGGAGGGLIALNRSAVDLRGTTFAHNTAEVQGGAILVNGSDLRVDDCVFLENEVSPGVSEVVAQSSGAAIVAAPGTGLDVTGIVANSLFVDNIGLAIQDVDFAAGPFNRVRYDGNRFRSTVFGGKIYQNVSVSFDGMTAAQLNGLVVGHSGGPSVDKSQIANQALGSSPREGRLVAAPSIVLSTVPPNDPDNPTSAYLGYAWSGSTATLAGTTLADKSGTLAVDGPGDYSLRVNGSTEAVASVTEPSCGSDTSLCLSGERFLVEVTWRDFVGKTGSATVVPGGSDDSGLFWFFGANNWEMLVKVLDGCAANDHFWVFSAATTNVEYTLKVTDTISGVSKSYFNPLGNAASAVTDTGAFATCSGGSASPAPPGWQDLSLTSSARSVERTRALHGAPGAAGSCRGSATEICLSGGRFLVEVTWRDFVGQTGSATVVPLRSDDSGLFWFFDANNWEMLVKVLDACAANERFWVFSAATTNVEYTLKVTDTTTGESKSYFNPLGEAAAAITDTDAFATCQ